MTDKINLKPIEQTKEQKPEEEKKFFVNLPISEADYLMQQAANICMMYQGTPTLPDTSKIDTDPNFYIEELIKILIDHGIITS